MQRISFSDRHSGILLLAFGGPSCLDDVEPFLRHIFADRVLPSSFIDAIRQRYRRIGGRSPLPEITRRQALALQESLFEAGRRINVFIGMRHWKPSIEAAFRLLEANDIQRVFCLIMAPFSSAAAVGAYHDAVHEAKRNLKKKMDISFVTGWYTTPYYLDAVAERIREGLVNFPSPRHPNVRLLFTAHSLPLSALTEDPYTTQITSTIAGVTDRLKDYSWHLAFQSQGKGCGPWLSPRPEEVLADLAREGVKEILAVPLGFVADHLETLYDLDISLKERAAELGLQLQRSPALNESPKFITALTDAVLRSLAEEEQTAS
ncbi:MAG: ferrochelatase [Deltaproteobacteria bacterium]|nr:ferrochelatase [Deltaproteobacteria bacterium]